MFDCSCFSLVAAALLEMKFAEEVEAQPVEAVPGNLLCLFSRESISSFKAYSNSFYLAGSLSVSW